MQQRFAESFLSTSVMDDDSSMFGVGDPSLLDLNVLSGSTQK